MNTTAHSPSALPDRFRSEEELDDFLATPDADLIADLEQVEGDLMVLGVAGKMGPTLARLARNAAPGKRVIGVARFSDPVARQRLEHWGIETIKADLLDRAQVAALPKVANIVFAAGRKFGSHDSPSLTWAMNTYVPAIVAEGCKDARIVAFSTGNVYPLVSVLREAADEKTPVGPRGEYAQSCVGRERMFEHFSHEHGTAGRIIRLNYAIDLRYGVLHDIATRVKAGTPIDLSLMGHVNVIWQGDANAQVLRSLRHCTAPTTPLNITGPETISVRWLATELGKRMGVAPKLVGEEPASAWLSDAGLAANLFGYPRVPLAKMIDWVGDWVAHDGLSLGKPTKYEVRDGAF